ncbi:MAG: hypothetical protein A2Z88_09160 [Omnitrophica WOR_2 bacterium GWA2_47_8]|nr:MAG: hypothetical protein A2Z88_09160 [Omnitrophica WOR_2 bacterium GWA2_47_8]
MSGASLIFIIIYYVLIIIPCIGTAWLGAKMMNAVGQYPSKTPMIQMNLVVKLVFLEVVSFTLLLVFFKVLVAD